MRESDELNLFLDRSPDCKETKDNQSLALKTLETQDHSLNPTYRQREEQPRQERVTKSSQGRRHLYLD